MFLLPNIPIAVVWLAGGLYALIRWRRHPGVSLLTFVACTLLFGNVLVGQVVHFWLWNQQVMLGGSRSQLQMWIELLLYVRISVSVIGYLLLLIAVFGWRFAPLYRPAVLEPAMAPTRPANEPEGIRKPGGAV
jgi:hypothetical protein